MISSLCRSVLILLLAVGVAHPVFAADKKELKQLKKDFAKALSEENEEAAISVFTRLGEIGDEDAREELYNLGFGYATTPTLYAAAVSTLSSFEGMLEFLDERYGKVDNKGDFRERVFLADITAKVPGDDAIVSLTAYLADNSPFVTGAAVEHLANSMSRAAIEPLIELLKELSKKPKDVLYHQVRDGLWKLTGQDFDIIDDWMAWWEPNRATFDPKSSEHEGKDRRRAEAPRRRPRVLGGPRRIEEHRVRHRHLRNHALHRKG